jgi:hypothetical protein
MKWIFVFTYDTSLFYIKAQINSKRPIQIISDKDFLKIFKRIVVTYDDKSIIKTKEQSLNQNLV